MKSCEEDEKEEEDEEGGGWGGIIHYDCTSQLEKG
jgi:hypothetical protein